VIWEDELEPVFAAVVQELATVCAGVCACDRESEPGTLARLAAVELFENLLDRVVGDAAAVVGDADPQMGVVLCGGENDRWCAVGGGVGEQVAGTSSSSGVSAGIDSAAIFSSRLGRTSGFATTAIRLELRRERSRSCSSS
jgi:hypothetical protein